MDWSPIISAASGFLGSLIGGAIALVVSKRSVDAQLTIERRRARDAQKDELRRQMRERFDEQRKAFEDFESLTLEAYRGPLEASAKEARRREALAFRIRALFAFGDEKFANELMGTIMLLEDEQLKSKTGDYGGDLPSVARRQKRLSEEMLRAIGETKSALALPEIRVTAQLDERVERAIQRTYAGRAPPKD